MSKKTQKLVVPLISVILGIILGAIIMVIFGYDPIWAYEGYFKKHLAVSRILAKFFAL